MEPVHWDGFWSSCLRGLELCSFHRWAPEKDLTCPGRPWVLFPPPTPMCEVRTWTWSIHSPCKAPAGASLMHP